MAIDDKFELLSSGDLTVTGRLVDASNATLYATVTQGDQSMICIYKPIAGERPLWDFPDGALAYREYAAYLISKALGLNLVPLTILRDGPMVLEWYRSGFILMRALIWPHTSLLIIQCCDPWRYLMRLLITQIEKSVIFYQRPLANYLVAIMVSPFTVRINCVLYFGSGLAIHCQK